MFYIRTEGVTQTEFFIIFIIVLRTAIKCLGNIIDNSQIWNLRHSKINLELL